MLHGVCRRILGNPDDALDATQEALLAIARKIGSFDGRAKFSTWAYRVATNAALDEARRRGRRPVPSEHLPESGAGHATVHGTIHGSGRVGIVDVSDVDAALAQLTPTTAPRSRSATSSHGLRRHRRGVGIPPGTVASRISRGRAALADLLGNRKPPRSIQHVTMDDGRPSPFEPSSSTRSSPRSSTASSTRWHATSVSTPKSSRPGWMRRREQPYGAPP